MATVPLVDAPGASAGSEDDDANEADEMSPPSPSRAGLMKLRKRMAELRRRR